MLPIVILAGGLATRLGTLTAEVPKSLIEINGRPFIDWQMDKLVNAGYSYFVLCLSHKSNLIQNYLGDGTRWGVDIHYSLDGEIQLGTGGAVKKALPILGQKFAVTYGDSYLPINYSEIEGEFLLSGKKGLMTVYENTNKFDQSNVEYSTGSLHSYDKIMKNSRMRHIDYGLTYFRTEAFQDFEESISFDLSDIYFHLLKTEELGGFEVFERFYEIGSHQGIEDFSGYLRKVSL
jgi:MurNAc alpha-1-phosphate uridylyltransferase